MRSRQKRNEYIREINQEDEGNLSNMFGHFSSLFSPKTKKKSYHSITESEEQLQDQKPVSGINDQPKRSNGTFYFKATGDLVYYFDDPVVNYEENDNDSNLEQCSSWDTNTTINTISTISSTLSTDTDAFCSHEPIGEFGDEEVTLDDFKSTIVVKSSEIFDDEDERDDENVKIAYNEPRPLKTIEMDENLEDVYKSAMHCIAEKSWRELATIIGKYPKILTVPFKNRNDENKSESKVRGCYAGTILHILVSQKPKLMKKKVKKNAKNSLSSLSWNAPMYDIHFTYPVPHELIKKIIIRQPIALFMVDEFGRTPLHCAVLSLRRHLKEMNKYYGDNAPKKTYEISRYFIRMENNINLLIENNRNVAKFSDYRGNLPLHYAADFPKEFCQKCALVSKAKGVPNKAIETVKILYEAYPRAISRQNKKGSTPIHNLCSNGLNINLDLLKTLLSYHCNQGNLPTERDIHGDPPLHVAVKKRASHEAVALFTHFDSISDYTPLFVQKDLNNNSLLHVALMLTDPPPCAELISVIISVAPFISSVPNQDGIIPIRYATSLNMPSHIIKTMLSKDMPIELGKVKESYPVLIEPNFGEVGFARHSIERPHHHSWWHLAVEVNDRYLNTIFEYLSEEATHQQILTLARQIGPDGKSILIEKVSENCRTAFGELLRFYDRYEILLDTQCTELVMKNIKPDVQIFCAFDHGLSLNRRNNGKLQLCQPNDNQAGFTSIKCRNKLEHDTGVEVSFFDSKDKCKVILKTYIHEEAFFAEIKLREKYNVSTNFLEEIYNYHRDETYTHLTLSESEKMCCITFERPDHTLADVFASVSAASRTSRWFNKCRLVLRQIASALKHIHEQGIIHGHLEPENIARYGNLWKLTNAGKATQIGSVMGGLIRSCVPPESIIEVCENKCSSFATDSDIFDSWSPKTCNQPLSSRVKFAESSNLNSGSNNSRIRRKKMKLFGSNVKGNEVENNIKIHNKRERRGEESFTAGANESNKLSRNPLIFAPQNCTASTAWDIWAFGLIMVQILVGRCTHLPNFERADDALIENLYKYDRNNLRKIYENVKKACGDPAAELIVRLLHPDPKRRPSSMSKVLCHKYFT